MILKRSFRLSVPKEPALTPLLYSCWRLDLTSIFVYISNSSYHLFLQILNLKNRKICNFLCQSHNPSGQRPLCKRVRCAGLFRNQYTSKSFSKLFMSIWRSVLLLCLIFLMQLEHRGEIIITSVFA